MVGAFFATDKKTGRVTGAYTISKDGAIFTWSFVEGSDDSPPPSPGTPEQEAVQDGEAELDGDEPVLDGGSRKRKSFRESEEPDTTPLHFARWELQKKDFFMQSPAKLTACDYHRELDMVVVGFSNGVFGLYQMPDFVCLHLLSISREKITTAIFNSLGNWLVFGCAKLGQLLVWEWRSESYILKQQGHYFDVNCIAYSPDSQLLATGADDNKVKVCVTSSDICTHYYTLILVGDGGNLLFYVIQKMKTSFTVVLDSVFSFDEEIFQVKKSIHECYVGSRKQSLCL